MAAYDKASEDDKRDLTRKFLWDLFFEIMGDMSEEVVPEVEDGPFNYVDQQTTFQVVLREKMSKCLFR